MKKTIIAIALIIAACFIAVASRMIYNANIKVEAASDKPEQNIWLLLDTEQHD